MMEKSTDEGPPKVAPEQPVDRAVGLKYAAGSVELYERVLGRFRDLHASDHLAMRQALAAGDGATTRRLLHSLKGLAAMVGAQPLRDEALRLENLCKAGATDAAIAADLDGLERRLAEAFAAIDQLRQELRAAPGSHESRTPD
jgi:two-component system, sensor histidine kinase and response regulator